MLESSLENFPSLLSVFPFIPQSWVSCVTISFQILKYDKLDHDSDEVWALEIDCFTREFDTPLRVTGSALYKRWTQTLPYSSIHYTGNWVMITLRR